MLWTLLGVFAGGLALNLTPCVYPMIPITVSFFGGRTARDKPGQIKLVLHGLCYLMGLALTNSILGVVAALTGGFMGAMLQNPIVLALVAGVLICFATSLFGLWELRLPGALTQAAGKSYSGYFGSLFMGFTLGVVAAPCIGPFVLGLLTWVAGMGSAWLGFLVFFTLSLGLGLPLFVLALFPANCSGCPGPEAGCSGCASSWAGSWWAWRPTLSGRSCPNLQIVLPVAVALAAGLHLGWIDKSQAGFQGLSVAENHRVGTACLVWRPSGSPPGPARAGDRLAALFGTAPAAGGRTGKKPVIIDFYADWCTPAGSLKNGDLSPSPRWSGRRKGFYHGQGGCDPGRQSASRTVAEAIQCQRGAHHRVS
jgi:thioredoxin:protein disulfide reductase